MAEGRRGFLAGLLLGLAPAGGAAVAAPARPAPGLLTPAQYYGPPPYYRGPRRGRRCWMERRRVLVRNRWGRLVPRLVRRRVCR